ncbi:hypothetical protein B0T17DRAFT_651238 [Bombardia bombarda]|uniref:Uncharacterized protein n=1 Tax=Bombardia bombarda TaxID=252184 RepID=A0AA40CGH2_9PEZI|nr:hypothetical protein B0T17DRAFT_651238 [Bombardia bombarda]
MHLLHLLGIVCLGSATAVLAQISCDQESCSGFPSQCPTVSRTVDICSSCFTADCITTQTVTASCGCPEPLVTIFRSHPCALGCDGLGACATEYALLNATDCPTTSTSTSASSTSITTTTGTSTGTSSSGTVTSTSTTSTSTPGTPAPATSTTITSSAPTTTTASSNAAGRPRPFKFW